MIRFNIIFQTLFYRNAIKFLIYCNAIILIYENQKYFNTTINKIKFSTNEIKFESFLFNDFNLILFMNNISNIKQIKIKLVQELIQLIFNNNFL